MNKFYLFCLIILLFCACSNKHKKADVVAVGQSATIPILYAKGFTLSSNENYVCVKVFNPLDKNKLCQEYYLVKDSFSMSKTPNLQHTFLVPLQTLALTSCTHIPFLDILGQLEAIKIICSPNLVFNQTIRDKYANGDILSAGDAFNLNIEILLKNKPSAVMLTGYSVRDENAEMLERYGLKVLLNNEWMEDTPLGRAEWIKFFAAFFDCMPLADSLFNIIETNYLETKKYAQTYLDKPIIMPGGNYRGTWYVPGGQTYMAHLFEDAGAEYYYATDSSTGSLPLNFEKVLEVFDNADIWLNAPTTTKKELYAIDERHALFKAFKNGEIYAFKKRLNKDGANDFWENAVVEPNIILRDMIWAIHKEEREKYDPKYLIKVK